MRRQVDGWLVGTSGVSRPQREVFDANAIGSFHPDVEPVPNVVINFVIPTDRSGISADFRWLAGPRLS